MALFAARRALLLFPGAPLDQRFQALEFALASRQLAPGLGARLLAGADLALLRLQRHPQPGQEGALVRLRGRVQLVAGTGLQPRGVIVRVALQRLQVLTRQLRLLFQPRQARGRRIARDSGQVQQRVQLCRIHRDSDPVGIDRNSASMRCSASCSDDDWSIGC